MSRLALAQQITPRNPIVFQTEHHEGEELARNRTTFPLAMVGVSATVGTGTGTGTFTYGRSHARLDICTSSEETAEPRGQVDPE